MRGTCSTSTPIPMMPIQGLQKTKINASRKVYSRVDRMAGGVDERAGHVTTTCSRYLDLLVLSSVDGCSVDSPSQHYPTTKSLRSPQNTHKNLLRCRQPLNTSQHQQTGMHTPQVLRTPPL